MEVIRLTGKMPEPVDVDAVLAGKGRKLDISWGAFGILHTVNESRGEYGSATLDELSEDTPETSDQITGYMQELVDQGYAVWAE